MNRDQLGVALSTCIVIGIALLGYASSKSGKSRTPAWVWLAAVPYLTAGILAVLLRGLIIMIGWPIGRLIRQEALYRKWLASAETIIFSACFILVAISTGGGLVWLVVHLIMGS
jgi:hypothetical protein